MKFCQCLKKTYIAPCRIYTYSFAGYFLSGTCPLLSNLYEKGLKIISDSAKWRSFFLTVNAFLDGGLSCAGLIKHIATLLSFCGSFSFCSQHGWTPTSLLPWLKKNEMVI